MAGFWALGSHVVAPLSLRSLSEEERERRRSRFSSTCQQRMLMLLFVVYPGVSISIFGMFPCTQIGTSWLLTLDMRIVCYDRLHWEYTAAAIVWLLLVPIGVPLFFNILLRRYRVPDMAKLIEDNSWLREAAEHAWRIGMPQPAVDFNTLCCDTIEDDHLAVLHAALLHDATASEAADILAGCAHTPKARSKKMKEAEREEPAGLVGRLKAKVLYVKSEIAAVINPATRLGKVKSFRGGADVDRGRHMSELLLWCRHGGVLSITASGWADKLGLPESAPPKGAHQHPPHACGLYSHEVPALIKLATKDCGFLFAVYTSKCYYWESVELIRKLVFTSVLALISPGSAGQVVVGLMVALLSLLANIKLKPYARSSVNIVNQGAHANLYLLLLCGLLLKVNLDGDNTAGFYGDIVTVVSVLPLALPFLLQGYIALGGFGEEGAEQLNRQADQATMDS